MAGEGVGKWANPINILLEKVKSIHSDAVERSNLRVSSITSLWDGSDGWVGYVAAKRVTSYTRPSYPIS